MFNQYSLSVMGIMFEVIGSFFLTTEALGGILMDRFLAKYINFSEWFRKSFLRLAIASSIPIISIIALGLFKSKVPEPLSLPSLILILSFPILIDHARGIVT